MSALIIDNHIINYNLVDVLKKINYDTHGVFFSKIKKSGTNIITNCPFHKGGAEAHPSFSVLDTDELEIEKGYCRCFTCNESGPLYHIVGYCYRKDDDFGKQWLVDNFSNVLLQTSYNLPKIELDKNKSDVTMNDSIIRSYEYYHPYMWKRKLSKEIVDLFEVGFNPKSQSITFPVRNEKGQLVMITERSVNSKKFYIQSGIEKPVYLLNYIIKWNIKSAIVCEAQIDALTAWTYGYPAVAILGVGSSKQYEIMRRSGVRHWITMFDNDDAGKQATERFNKNIGDQVIVTNITMPQGIKDINDMSKEQFLQLLSPYIS